MGAIARSDVELVEASRRGEHEAFGHLVERYQDVVCAVSYSSTGDHGLSEDVAQETFIAAWRQLDRLRDDGRLRPWLCGIARNLARNARKRKRREEPVDVDEHVAADVSPFEATARGEAERVVREALARIPDAYREVLVLYYREDRSIREVAAALGTSEAAVMQRLSRGRRYLADSVTQLVERSLEEKRPRRDLVAAVVAAIAALTVAPHVDASTSKGSTMLKYVLTASAVAAIGTTAYFVYPRSDSPAAPAATATVPGKPGALHYGAGKLGLAHAPTLGPTAAPRAIHSRSVAQNDLALLPADSDVVMGLNFAQLQKSALWQRFVAPKLASITGTHDFEAKCGFDPLASLGSISLGFKHVGDSPTGVVVVHGFDKTKAMACLARESGSHLAQHDANLQIDGDVVLFTEEDHHAGFTFTDATTAVVVIGPEAATREGVERVAHGSGGLPTSSVFSDALQYVNTDASLWLMVGEGSPLLGHINEEIAKHAPVQLGTTYLSLQVGDNLALDAGFRMGNPETVAKVVAAIQNHMNQPEARAAVSQYFDQFDVTADGSDVIVSVAITGDQLVGLAMMMAMHGSAHASVSVSTSP